MLDRNHWGVQMRTLAAILMLLALTSAPVLAAPSRACLTQSAAAKAHPGQYLKYRQVGSTRCWFAGATPEKSEFKIIHANLRAESPHQQSGAQRLKTAPAADDALVGLAGTLCAGPCEDLRTINPKELAARREAANNAYVEYWLSYSDHSWLSFADRWAL